MFIVERIVNNTIEWNGGCGESTKKERENEK